MKDRSWIVLLMSHDIHSPRLENARMFLALVLQVHQLSRRSAFACVCCNLSLACGSGLRFPSCYSDSSRLLRVLHHVVSRGALLPFETGRHWRCRTVRVVITSLPETQTMWHRFHRLPAAILSGLRCRCLIGAFPARNSGALASSCWCGWMV